MAKGIGPFQFYQYFTILEDAKGKDPQLLTFLSDMVKN